MSDTHRVDRTMHTPQHCVLHVEPNHPYSHPVLSNCYRLILSQRARLAFEQITRCFSGLLAILRNAPARILA